MGLKWLCPLVPHCHFQREFQGQFHYTQSQTLTLKHTRCNINADPRGEAPETAGAAKGRVWCLSDTGARPGTCQAQPCPGQGDTRTASPAPAALHRTRPRFPTGIRFLTRDPGPASQHIPRFAAAPSATAAHVAGPGRADPSPAGPLRPFRSSGGAGDPRRSRRHPG